MPLEPETRLTVSVGRQEFEELLSAWAEYTDATRTEPGQIDPVRALRHTGEVLRALDRMLTSLSPQEDNSSSSVDARNNG